MNTMNRSARGFSSTNRVSAGFTLLEIIVSIGIFTVVMLAGTSAYLTLVSLDRQARATTTLVDSLSFAVESMARAVRTGTSYGCGGLGGGNCTSGGSSLYFTDSSGRAVSYTLSSGKIVETISGVSSFITDPGVSITGLTFFVRGVGTGDGHEPQVLFTIRGTMVADQGKTQDFTIESGATERALEL